MKATSSVSSQTETLRTSRPQTFRLPNKKGGDPHFGLSRSHYYVGESLGWWKLIRLRRPGKQKGITLVNYRQVADHIRKQQKEAA